MEKRKPIELMLSRYGEGPQSHTCKECCNFISYCAGARTIFKCKAYGITCSNRSDWAKRWISCGLFGRQVSGQAVSDVVKRAFYRHGTAQDQIEGQTEMEGL